MAFTAKASWKAHLRKSLPLLGHRNWIAVTDAAYPCQTSTGVETVDTGDDFLPVLRTVSCELSAAPHVRAVAHVDAELAHVAEADAEGVGKIRDGIHTLLRGQHAVHLPHEEIIAKLDEAGKAFRILLLKTRLTIPYTSVFIQLECGYWSPEAERRLRASLAKHS